MPRSTSILDGDVGLHMQTLTNLALIIGIVSAALTIGLPLSVRVYRPMPSSRRFFHAATKIAAAAACVAMAVVIFAYVAWNVRPS
jgi:hypothetical protein